MSTDLCSSSACWSEYGRAWQDHGRPPVPFGCRPRRRGSCGSGLTAGLPRTPPALALELSAGSHARRRARRPASAADVVTGLPSLPEADQAGAVDVAGNDLLSSASSEVGPRGARVTFDCRPDRPPSPPTRTDSSGSRGGHDSGREFGECPMGGPSCTSAVSPIPPQRGVARVLRAERQRPVSHRHHGPVLGPVARVRVRGDGHGGRRRQNAISQLNGRELDGRRITVEVSNPQAPRTGGAAAGVVREAAVPAAAVRAVAAAARAAYAQPAVEAGQVVA